MDVLVLGSVEQSPPVKDLFPLLGALKHMSCWHSAKITVVTQNMSGWGIPQTPPFSRCLPTVATRGHWKNTRLYLLRSLEAKEAYLMCIITRYIWKKIYTNKIYSITMHFLVLLQFLLLSFFSCFVCRWQKMASYLCATLIEPTDLRNHIDSGELWRGALVIREKTVGDSDQW